MRIKSLYTEKELVLRLRQGEQSAFSALYSDFSPRIYANLRRLLKDEELAREMLQEVFVKVWERREQVDPESSFKSYLYRIAENMVRDFFRRAARDLKLFDKLVLAMSDLYVTNEDLYIAKEDNAIFNKAVNSLPPQRKRIYTLCKIEGRSYEEVAAELGISVSTINDHIVKATKAVRAQMRISGDVAVLLLAAAIIEKL